MMKSNELFRRLVHIVSIRYTTMKNHNKSIEQDSDKVIKCSSVLTEKFL